MVTGNPEVEDVVHSVQEQEVGPLGREILGDVAIQCQPGVSTCSASVGPPNR
jgi:hypothetical protein